MSYAGNISRSGRRGSATGAAPSRPTLAATPGTPASRPPGPRPETEIAWREVAIFAAGIALGAVVGAGTAFLVAPESGDETRAALARRSRRLGRRAHDAWDDLRDELRFATRRGRRRVRRAFDERGLSARAREDCD